MCNVQCSIVICHFGEAITEGDSMRRKTYIAAAAIFLVFGLKVYAQQRGQNASAPAPKRASLIFREDFKGKAAGAEAEIQLTQDQLRSEERRVGKECRTGWWTKH